MIRTIDAHAGGGGVRLVVDGFLSPPGRTMLDKRQWLSKHGDRRRRGLLLEPRGHADLCGALLTEPVSPGAHAGLLFMHNDGYPTMSGHGVIAAATIAVERGLIMAERDAPTLIFDTPAGTVRARAHLRARGAGPARGPRVERVAFTNVPSFVLHAGVSVSVRHRHVRADIGFGGAFYAIVDSEALGLAIDSAHLPELRRAGMELARAIESSHTIAHPLEGGLTGIAGTVFTSPPRAEASALRNVTVFAEAAADRSPSGTGTAAVMAVLDAMGLLGPDMPFVHESFVGTHFAGRIVGRTTVGDYPAIIPEIEGSAWITGEHTFFFDEDDPLEAGFRA